MSRFQSAFCRSAPWRSIARRVVLPWALHGFRPHGDVLEIGAGSGAMAAELLAMHPEVRLTATDFDDEMVKAAAARLSPFGDRATTRPADATALPFPDASFDVVFSWVMLHHTVEWEKALAEAVRVLRPGGHVVGYDLLSTAPLRMLHRHDGDHGHQHAGDHAHRHPGARLRMMRLPELRAALADLPVDQAVLTPGVAGLVVRFSLRKASAA